MKNKNSRLSIPGKIIDLLWYDDEFFREVSNIKKVSDVKFPKYDHWLESNNFYMEFALAGYSPEDISIIAQDNVLTLRSEKRSEDKVEESSENVLSGLPKLQTGVVVRGIARRSFEVKFFISPEFDLENSTATMKNGLLQVIVPVKRDRLVKNILIKE
jgi:HSP20 family molecular chaperone IbpA